MATKRIETQLTIKAVDKYSGMLRNMKSVTGRFADGVRTEMGGLQRMRGPLKLIEDFRRQQTVVRQSGEALEAAREKQRRLLAEIKKTRQPTAQMRREFERARKAADQLEQKHRQNRRALHGLQAQLHEAGVETGDLAREQRRLAGALDRGTTAFGRQMERMRRLERMQSRIAEGRERMDRTLARSANLSFVGAASAQTGRRIVTGLSAPAREAINFESAMSDVRKVVDFDSPEAFRQMSHDILDLSTRIPMAAEGLAQIVASGGQSGVARGELLKFAEMAAKIGVAFDISAEKSGDAMASIKTAMGLTLDETGALFDAMNHLSNKSAARADRTLDFLNRAGADGARFGFEDTETLAIGAAMIAAGAGADTAATSFRNMGRALTRGESATKRQSQAMARLGLEASQVARAMQEDAVGTTIDVLRRLNELPDHLRASVISDLFGDEARELSKLLNNMQLMPDMLALVENKEDYLGSAEAEYAARAKATENNEELVRNSWKELKTVAGETVLPAYNEILTLTKDILKSTTAWIEEHPELTKWLLIGGTALGAMAVAGGALLTAAAGLIGTMAVLRFGLVGLGARAAFAAGDVMGLRRSIGRLGRTRMSLRRPNLAPHLADFADFRRGAVRELDTLDRRHNTVMKNIAKRRAANRMLWGGILAGAGRFLLKGGAIGAGVGLGLGIKPTANAELTPEAANADYSQDALDEMARDAWMRQAKRRKAPTLLERWGIARPAPGASAGNLPGDPETRSAVDTVLQFAGEDKLPTPERIAQLREEVAAYRAEVEAAQSALDATPEFGSGITNPLRVQAQANLDAAEAGLRDAQQSMSEAEAASGQLGEALRVLDGTEAAPRINAASIDRALEKVRQLSAGLSSLPGGAASSEPDMPSARKPAGARAFGGPVRAGLPYLVNENTPRSELFVPSMSGGILNVPQAQAAFRSYLSSMGPRTIRRNPVLASLNGGAQRVRAAGLATLSAAAVSLPAAAATPPAAAGPAGGGVKVEIGSVSIQVPSGVTDPEAIAEMAADRIGQRIEATMSASFTDRS